MSSRFVDPSTMRTRSPIYYDESPKRPPPSPSNKAPPSKKFDTKSRAVSEEPCPSSEAPQTVSAPSSDTEPCTDKVCRPVSHNHASRPPPMLHRVPTPSSANHLPPKSSSNRVVVDMEVFGQILELDEDDNRGFSQGMVKDYLDQAQSTIKLMDECLCAGLSLQSDTDVSLALSTKHELTQLGKLGHFLKGSSAALGALQVQEICEKIQHLGNRVDSGKEPEVKIPAEDAFAKIKPLLVRLKGEQAEAAKQLNEEINRRI
ncbi:signal transduction histidine kinase [Lanmaoa asiatica]|nr:signal transduction histidine kinase [Lanmaoa asiatica]